MRKLISSINISLDGYADHTVAIADDELHDFYTEQLDSIGTVLFGRVTYQLFEAGRTRKMIPPPPPAKSPLPARSMPSPRSSFREPCRRRIGLIPSWSKATWWKKYRS